MEEKTTSRNLFTLPEGLITSFGISLNKSLGDVKEEALQSVRCQWPSLFEEKVNVG